MTRRRLPTYLTFGLLILAALEIPLGWMQQRNEQQHAQLPAFTSTATAVPTTPDRPLAPAP